MTNEEAKHRLLDIERCTPIHTREDARDFEALEMAIKALSQDTISREVVLSKIKEVCFSKEWTQFRIDNGSNGQRDFLINYIEQLSSVTQKSGEWKVTPMSKIAYCSICDELIKDVPASIVTQFEFCPKCGSRMVVSQEREDKE